MGCRADERVHGKRLPGVAALCSRWRLGSIFAREAHAAYEDQGVRSRDRRDGLLTIVIALLAVLGVDLIVVVVFAVLVVGRRRLKRQPGEFAGAVRVSSGAVDGLSAKWRRGWGRWVRDVFVWSKGPFMYRTVLVPVDGVGGERQAQAGEVKRLGDTPVVDQLTSGDTTIEVAAKAEDSALVGAAFMTEQEGKNQSWLIPRLTAGTGRTSCSSCATTSAGESG
jgi:hypothetical protein